MSALLRHARRPTSRALRRSLSSTTLSTANATHLETWIHDNAASFAPPVMNKLMHRDQLSVMFVGGPNQREDFHIEAGSEFFYQMRGNMELAVVQAGRRELVTIREGDVYLLPSRIPHSPQRPERGSIGLVIERKRSEEEPPDGLRYYTDFATCERVLWERYFHCYDLGRDLAPIVAAFNASEEKVTRVPSATSVIEEPPIAQDTTTVVPPPFNLNEWLARHDAALDGGSSLDLFEPHPDREFRVQVIGGGSAQRGQRWERSETFLLQLRGDATVELEPSEAASSTVAQQVHIAEGSCYLVPAGQSYSMHREPGSRGLVVANDPLGNVS